MEVLFFNLSLILQSLIVSDRGTRGAPEPHPPLARRSLLDFPPVLHSSSFLLFCSFSFYRLTVLAGFTVMNAAQYYLYTLDAVRI